MSERDEIIAEMREYFEQRADAEYLPGSPDGSPNEEMTMLWKLDRLQAAREQEGGEVVYQLKSKFGGGWDDVSEDEYSCAHESYVRRALYTHPSQSQGVPEICDGKEQEAFERYAARMGYDMTEHPLHYLFLSDRTSTARDAWKAAISYCHEVATTPPADKPEGEWVKALKSLRDSISGDCYMGEVWELETIDTLLSEPDMGGEK